MSVISKLMRERDYGYYRAKQIAADAEAQRKASLLRVREKFGGSARAVKAERRVNRRYERKIFRAEQIAYNASLAAVTLADWDKERWG